MFKMKNWLFRLTYVAVQFSYQVYLIENALAPLWTWQDADVIHDDGEEARGGSKEG